MAGRRFLVLAVLVLTIAVVSPSRASASDLGSEAFWVELEQKYGEHFPAVVVLDEAECRYDDFNLDPWMRVHRIVAILDPVAGQKFGESKFTIFKGEKVEGLKLFVQRGSGKREQVAETYVMEKPLSKNRRQVIMTVPKLEKRTLIDVSYKISDRFWLLRYFGEGVPVMQAKFTLAVPGWIFKDWTGWERTAVIKRPGSLKTETKDEGSVGTLNVGSVQQGDQMGGVKVFSWALNDIPAFSTDELSPALRDRAPFVALDMSNRWSWKDFTKSFHKQFEKQVAVDGEVKKKALELTASIPDSVEKAKAIFEYVKKQIECETDAVGYLTPQEVAKTLKERKGDCADVNGLLISMLRSAGIPAEPLLVKWRNNGVLDARIVESTEIDWQLACVKLGGKTYLLDGGHRLCPFNLVASDLEATLGLLVDSDEGWFTRLPVSGPESNTMTRTTELVLTDDGALKGTCKEQKTGLRAYFTRSFCRTTSDADIKAYYENKFSKVIQGATLKQYSFGNLDNEELPLDFSAEFATDGYFLPGDSQIRICPGEIVDASVKPTLEKKPEYAEYLPELTHRWSSRDAVTITIPTGYRVAALPAGLRVDNAWFRYAASFTQPSPDRVTFLRELEVKVRKPELPFDQFKGLLDQFAKTDVQCIEIIRE